MDTKNKFSVRDYMANFPRCFVETIYDYPGKPEDFEIVKTTTEQIHMFDYDSMKVTTEWQVLQNIKTGKIYDLPREELKCLHYIYDDNNIRVREIKKL